MSEEASLPTVVCAVCTHSVREPGDCDCHCHWDCDRTGHHRYAPTGEDIARRTMVCYRCGAATTLLEAN